MLVTEQRGQYEHDRNERGRPGSSRQLGRDQSSVHEDLSRRIRLLGLGAFSLRPTKMSSRISRNIFYVSLRDVKLRAFDRLASAGSPRYGSISPDLWAALKRPCFFSLEHVLLFPENQVQDLITRANQNWQASRDKITRRDTADGS